MTERYLVEIELPIWQDPQGDVLLKKSCSYCHIHVGCRNDKIYVVSLGD